MARLVALSGLVVCLAGCNGGGSAPFTLTVAPTRIADAIPGQHCVLLVTAQGDVGQSVHITGAAPNATMTVEHPTITSGQVAEVTVVPQAVGVATAQYDPGLPGRDVPVTIWGRHGDDRATIRVPIRVTSETDQDQIAPTAAQMRDLFIPWLAANRPDLGITPETQWTGTIVTPHILVVTHYLFLSPEWEMHVYWHVMIPPYDWAKIELRRRFAETTPSLEFEIPSRSADPIIVQQNEPPGELWR